MSKHDVSNMSAIPRHLLERPKGHTYKIGEEEEYFQVVLEPTCDLVVKLNGHEPSARIVADTASEGYLCTFEGESEKHKTVVSAFVSARSRLLVDAARPTEKQLKDKIVRFFGELPMRSSED